MAMLSAVWHTCPPVQLFAAAGGGRTLLPSLLGLFSEGAWPSAQHVVGAACRVESTLLTGSGTQWMRIVLEDLRQQEHSSAADHSAAGQQDRHQHLLGPGFIAGALQAFADSGMLGVRSVRLLDGSEVVQEPRELTKVGFWFPRNICAAAAEAMHAAATGPRMDVVPLDSLLAECMPGRVPVGMS